MLVEEPELKIRVSTDKVTQTEQITARTRQGSPLGFPQAQPRFGYGLDRGEEGH